MNGEPIDYLECGCPVYELENEKRGAICSHFAPAEGRGRPLAPGEMVEFYES